MFDQIVGRGVAPLFDDSEEKFLVYIEPYPKGGELPF